MVNVVDAPQITDIFLGKLYRRIKPSLAFQAETKEEFEAWKHELKSKIRELLGEFPEPAPLDPQLLSSEETEKFIREKWLIQSEPDCFVPLYLLIPKEGKGRKPAILCALSLIHI